MDDVEALAVRVRADTRGFAEDVAAMRASLEGSLGLGAEIAGRRIESALLRAARTGKFGFDELKGVALGVMDEIARAALRSGMGAAGVGSAGGLVAALAGLLGAPGRATGGPVSPARPYWVGERGPEIFVPASAGSVVAPVAARPREVRVAITVNASGDAAPRALAQSGRQVARAVKAALAGVD